ncbi:hypothetical protein ACT2CI_00025 [Candidatus Vidania fulgoroideorum]
MSIKNFNLINKYIKKKYFISCSIKNKNCNKINKIRLNSKKNRFIFKYIGKKVFNKFMNIRNKGYCFFFFNNLDKFLLKNNKFLKSLNIKNIYKNNKVIYFDKEILNYKKKKNIFSDIYFFINNFFFVFFKTMKFVYESKKNI